MNEKACRWKRNVRIENALPPWKRSFFSPVGSINTPLLSFLPYSNGNLAYREKYSLDEWKRKKRRKSASMMPDPLSVRSDENSPGDGDYSGEEERCDFFLSRKKIKSHDRRSFESFQERKSISQRDKIRKFESGRVCSKIERLKVYYFPRKEKRKERRKERHVPFYS